MHIEISLHDGVPIYRQIVNQVKYLVASGKIRAGDELPPIRTLAEQLMVTPNTIVKAYGELEDEGVVFKRRGAGTYVADLKSPLARKEQRRILEQRADALLTEAKQLNFTFDEVLDLLGKRNAIITKSLAQSVSKENFHVG
ncbi:MAG: GntR family transcriptional regulator [Pirellula sp.]